MIAVSAVLTKRVVSLGRAAVLRGLHRIPYDVCVVINAASGGVAMRERQGSWPWHRDQTKTWSNRTVGTLHPKLPPFAL